MALAAARDGGDPFVIDVLSLGGAYALMALGLVIVYGILRLQLLAYGELIMVAGYALFLMGACRCWHGRGGGARGDRDRHPRPTTSRSGRCARSR